METKTKDIRQTVIFDASPHDVFEMLMDSKKHAAFTGTAAKISREVGGKFEAWDGYNSGVNLELSKDRKIVQTWRGSDWPEGQYSKVTFLLEPAAGGRTKLTFMQTGVPAGFAKDISDGWKEYYWKKMESWISSNIPTS